MARDQYPQKTGGGSGPAHRREPKKSNSDTTRAFFNRRVFIAGLSGASLAGLAGCNSILFGESTEGPTPQPSTPTSTPQSGSEPQTQTDSESLLPEDFDDGCGKAGPGETVGGDREGIEFVIRPIGDQSQSTDEATVDGALWPVADTPLRNSISPVPAPSEISHIETLSGTQASPDCSQESIPADQESPRALIMGPTSSRIYPGALFNIDSVWRGQMRPVTADRAPIRISFSLAGNQFEGSAARVVSNPSISSVRNAINDLVRSVNPDTATRADMRSEMHSVYKHSQNHVDLGAHFDGLGREFGFEFGRTNESTTSKVLVTFFQNYFTVDVDIPNAFFVDGRDPSNKDAIVSSVTYGRLLLFAAESEYNAEDVQAAFRAALPGVGSGTIEAGHEQILEDSSLRVTALGGSGSAAAEVITNGLEGISSYVNEGAEYSPTSPASPISYQLTYLSDFSLAQVKMSTEYTQRVCDPMLLIRDLEFEGIRTYDGFLNNEVEIYGRVNIQAIDSSSSTEDRSLTPTNSSEREGGSTTSPEETSTTTESREGSSPLPGKTIWSAPPGADQVITLSEGDVHRVGEINTFEYPLDDESSPPHILRIHTELYEFEGENADDYLIDSKSQELLLSDVPKRSEDSSPQSMELTRDGTTIHVRFLIQRI